MLCPGLPPCIHPQNLHICYMVSNTEPVPSFWEVASARNTVMRALRIALIVGVLIAIINHGDRIVMQGMNAMDWLKCALTFLVPYAVSTYSSVQAVRDRPAATDGKRTPT